MFIWLTSPVAGQVLVNLNHVTTVACMKGVQGVQGVNAVYFTGDKEETL